MSGDWQATTIGDQIKLQRGHDITKKEQRMGNVPVISSGGIQSYHDTAKAKGPGVILGRKGSIGTVYYIDRDYWPHDTTLYVVDFQDNVPQFVYYFFRWNSERLHSLDGATANPALNRNHVHPIKTRWPPPAEQKAIASVLGALDDKIELNHQMNQTLESMARALYKSWFVDFDPVAANAAGKRPFGMDDVTASLFPDRFVDSELGPIPEGWESGTISEICRILRNSVDPTKEPDRQFAHFSIPALDAERAPVFELGHNIKSSKYHISRNSVLISKLNPETPRVSMPDVVKGVYPICSTEFLVCEPLTPWTRSALYCLFASTSFQVQFASLVGGTSKSHQRVKPPDFQAMKILMPSKELIQKFDEQTRYFFDLQMTNSRETETLARLRDLLLPKLMSGEIRISDAEKAVEEAV